MFSYHQAAPATANTVQHLVALSRPLNLFLMILSALIDKFRVVFNSSRSLQLRSHDNRLTPPCHIGATEAEAEVGHIH